VLSHREEIASCSEAAYDKLRLTDAQKLMMFKSAKEAEAYAKQVLEGSWLVEGVGSYTACVAGSGGWFCGSSLPPPAAAAAAAPMQARPCLLTELCCSLLLPAAGCLLCCSPQRGWTVTDGVIHFHKASAAGDEAGAQHMELINHTLVYAKELERIV
jgi:hypothetical protein